MVSRPSKDDEILELSCNFQGLQISIKGPPNSATEALAVLSNHFSASKSPPASSADRAPSPTPTDGSFDLVTTSNTPATRKEVEGTFVGCPETWIAHASRLTGSNLSGLGRVQRAWRAGQWAGAVHQGKVWTPSQTPARSLDNVTYMARRPAKIDLW